MRPLLARLGRRGACLLVFGVFDLVYAYSLFHPAREAARTASTRFVADIAPLWAWAALWLVVGLLCMWQAWICADRAAYAAAIFVKIVWGALFVAGGIIAGIPRAYVGALIWWAFAGLVAVIATWPEPEPEGGG